MSQIKRLIEDTLVQFENLELLMKTTTFELVGYFHRIFGIKYFDSKLPVIQNPPLEDIILRLDLIAEEFEELVEASLSENAFHYDDRLNFAEIFKILRSRIREIKEKDIEFDIVEVADALGDIVYVVNGAAHVFNFDLDAVVEEIHNSNMSKLDSNGKPMHRADGKIMKSELYRRPDIKKIILNGDVNDKSI